MTIPKLVARNLEDKVCVLPNDLEGTYNAVVITFQERQQTQVEAWLALLNRLAFEYDGLRSYVLAVNQYLPDFQDEFFATKPHFSDQNARKNTLVVYVDLNDFNLAFDLPTVSEIYTLLIDREGQILWRASGSVSEPRNTDGLIHLLNGRTRATHPGWPSMLPHYRTRHA